MKVIYIVTCGFNNKYAFAAKDRAEECAELFDGVVDTVPFDDVIGYSELSDD